MNGAERNGPQMGAPGADRRALVAGAGIAGATMALTLARRGYEVEVFERRSDPRASRVPGPSMNLGLSRRGVHSLDRLGLLDAVMEKVIPMYGRVIHDPEGHLTFQSYGTREQAIYAVQRSDLNNLLIDAADALPNVRFHFGRKLVSLDPEARKARFRRVEGAEGGKEERTYRLLIGADGVHSAVRRAIHRGARADVHRTYLPWGWKELSIPPGPGGAFVFEKNAFHLWPRGAGMLFAHPNLGGGFTCSLVLPFEGPVSFASLERPEEVDELFRTQYGDIAERVPDLAAQFAARPVVTLVDLRTSRWYHPEGVVLIGDAAHAVVPFYAQGMNAAFEDCRILDAWLAGCPDDLATAFRGYQRERKRHTDALADLSKQNFTELRDRVRSPALQARKKLDAGLHGVLGERWMPLHDIVTHTLKPYADAREQARRQDRIVQGALAGAGLLAAGLLARLSGRRRD